MITVLLVNHSISKNCGIHAHGIRLFGILQESTNTNFIYCEASSYAAVVSHIEKSNPKYAIYNYTDALMPWAADVVAKYSSITHLGMCHDVTQDQIIRGEKDQFFNYRIALDPTLKTTSKWFTSVRPLFETIIAENPSNPVPVIGSFGFYFPHKNFNTILNLVFSQFEEAKINLHITEAYFSDPYVKQEFVNFKEYIKHVNSIKESKIKISLSTDFISDSDQVKLLSKNDVNIFPYSQNYGSGPSSAIDYAISAGRPIMISDSYQFRHVYNRLPNLQVPIVDVIKSGNAEILKLQNEWSRKTLLSQYEGIINELQNRKSR